MSVTGSYTEDKPCLKGSEVLYRRVKSEESLNQMLKRMKRKVMEIMRKQFCEKFSLNFIKNALQDENEICQVDQLGEDTLHYLIVH